MCDELDTYTTDDLAGALDFALTRWRFGPGDDTLAAMDDFDISAVLVICEQIIRRTRNANTVRAVLLCALAQASAYAVESRAMWAEGELTAAQHRDYLKSWAQALGELLLDKVSETTALADAIG